MDIAIDPKILRSRQVQAWGKPVLAVLAFAVLLLLLRQWLMPSLSRAEIRTAIVEQGAVSTEVAASGTVVPKTRARADQPRDLEHPRGVLAIGQQRATCATARRWPASTSRTRT